MLLAMAPADEVSISQFREHSGPLFTEVVQRHTQRLIRRGRHDRGLLIGLDEVWGLLVDRTFAPQVMRGDDGVAIWLPEFELHGQGDTYAQAKNDLLAEVRVYVSEYLANADEYLRAPNRAGHFGHVLKARLADLRGQLEQVIFPGPTDLATLKARLTASA